MTRKDFELIAEAIRTLPGDVLRHDVLGRGRLAHHVARSLATTNERFDTARFVKACGVDA